MPKKASKCPTHRNYLHLAKPESNTLMGAVSKHEHQQSLLGRRHFDIYAWEWASIVLKLSLICDLKQ